MNRDKLKRYRKNRTELVLVKKSLGRLRGQLEAVEEVSGKVTKSGDDFPYIEEHMTVRMADPKKADPIKERIRKKEARKERLEAEIREAEEFIAGMPEGTDKEIFEMIYLEGMTQYEVGEAIGYTQGRVAQIIGGYLKD